MSETKPGDRQNWPTEGDEDSERLEKLMTTDPGLKADPLNAPISPASPKPIPAALAAPQPSRNILAGRDVRVPAPLVSPVREPCPHCEGTGYVPSISDYLRESIALVGESGDAIVRSFYAELLSLAPELASLFPADLLTSDETKGQRDKLLKALVALSEMYDPEDEKKMLRLDTALESFGRMHAAFVRPDGTVQGATWEEYAAVKAVLFRTLVAAAGSAWKREYTVSWGQAYDYAAAIMLAEQYRSGFTSPRFARS